MTSSPITDFWKLPATIARNKFVNKALCCWSLNIAVGCTHACRFCYVPDVSTNKMKLPGVTDPDSQWGDYVFMRPWDEGAFMSSLRRAEKTPSSELNADGNRAVMLCTTTDPYMVIRNADPERQRQLNETRAGVVRQALDRICTYSTLNVRILTRSPLARQDFGQMQWMGSRLLFGMSLPTLNEKLARVYEPHAPSPQKRLDTLRAAKEAGLHVYVALAPTYPECDEEDIRRTLSAIKELDPVTIYHEPINIRAQNAQRIAEHAKSLGITVNTGVFETKQAWAMYALTQLFMVERIADEMGLRKQLHLWPDADLRKHAPSEWLNQYWGKVSDWPLTNFPGDLSCGRPDELSQQSES